MGEFIFVDLLGLNKLNKRIAVIPKKREVKIRKFVPKLNKQLNFNTLLIEMNTNYRDKKGNDRFTLPL